MILRLRIAQLMLVGCIFVIAADGRLDAQQPELADENRLAFEAIPDLPDEIGVAGPIVGVIGDSLIVAGGGVIYSQAETTLARFAEVHGIPVIETQAGKGALAQSHPMNFGTSGVDGSAAANALAAQADLVIGIGTRFQDFTTGSWNLFQNPDRTLVSLNVAAYDAMKHGAEPLCCDARVGLELLGAALGDDLRAPEVDGEEASEAQIVAAFEHIESVREEIPLTYFEYGTLAALVVFAQAGVTTALLEVGLGGRLDAVNAIDPDGCLITNISMDHTDWLGDSLEAIAREKAGIMRAGVPVIYGSREMPAAIANAAERTGARLSSAGCDFSWSCDETGEGSWHWHGQRHTLRDLARLPLNGAHQLGNAAAVLALMEAVGVDTVLETGKVNAAFSTLVLAGRQQRIDAHERTWLLDGAHNAAGALSLASAVAGLAGDRRVLSVIGILNDKDASAIVASLAGVSDRFIALSPASTRALPAARLGAIMEEIGQIPVRVVSDPDAAMVAAVSDSRPGDLIVVAGSFYTLESALRWLAADGD